LFSTKKVWAALIALAVVLGACRSNAPATQVAPTMDPYAVYTAAAQTAEARMTEIAAVTPTVPAPTDTPMPATDTPEPSPTQPVTATVATQAAGQTSAPPVASGDKAEFVSDVTVPDGTDFSPGESFVKTWQLVNQGTTTWTTAYTLNYVSGALMDAPNSVNLPQEVPPGATVDISVNMEAPSDPGNYRSYWILKNASGQTFGVGPEANQSIWVDIDVTGEGGGPTNTPNPNLTLSVDNAQVSGDCPHTFLFTANFDLDQGGQVSYQLEAGANNSNINIDLPDPVQTPLGAGEHTLVYELEFTDTIEGWARLHVTEPSDVTSNQVSFQLTCQ
jgi:hypothetical protein